MSCARFQAQISPNLQIHKHTPLITGGPIGAMGNSEEPPKQCRGKQLRSWLRELKSQLVAPGDPLPAKHMPPSASMF